MQFSHFDEKVSYCGARFSQDVVKQVVLSAQEQEEMRLCFCGWRFKRGKKLQTKCNNPLSKRTKDVFDYTLCGTKIFIFAYLPAYLRMNCKSVSVDSGHKEHLNSTFRMQQTSGTKSHFQMSSMGNGDKKQ